MLIFPMHLEIPESKQPDHWGLAVVNFCASQILYYDSIRSVKHQEKYGALVRSGLDNLKMFIKQEHLRRKNSSMCTDLQIEYVTNTPQQTNDTDCGMFLLWFATNAASNSFDMWADTRLISNFREQIQRVIR